MVTQPPPVPAFTVKMMSPGSPGAVRFLDWSPMASPSPPKLVDDPSKTGEASWLSDQREKSLFGTRPCQLRGLRGRTRAYTPVRLMAPVVALFAEALFVGPDKLSVPGQEEALCKDWLDHGRADEDDGAEEPWE